MTATATAYGFGTRVNLEYEKSIEAVMVALKEQGFGVLTEIDVQATLKKKLDVDFRRYMILGACNPPLALKALTAELDIGLLLPCNVIVYEDGPDSSVISIVDPGAMLGIVPDPDLEVIADEARARLERVVAALSVYS